MYTKLYYFTFRMPEELSLDPGPYRRRIFLLKKNWKGVPLFMFVMRYLLTVLNNVTNELNRIKMKYILL